MICDQELLTSTCLKRVFGEPRVKDSGCSVNALCTENPLVGAKHRRGTMGESLRFPCIKKHHEASRSIKKHSTSLMSSVSSLVSLLFPVERVQYFRLQDRTPELYENAMAMLNLCEAAMVRCQTCEAALPSQQILYLLQSCQSG